MRRNVDLPMPLGPTMPTRSPGPTVSDTSSSTVWTPCERETWRATSTAATVRAGGRRRSAFRPPVAWQVVSSFLEAIGERVVVYDGATGTNLQLRELSPDDFGGPGLEGCNELLCDTRPDVVADLHRSFFEVGVDVVETNSFGTLPWVLAEYGIPERTTELARKAARIAREVADAFGDAGGAGGGAGGAGGGAG